MNKALFTRLSNPSTEIVTLDLSAVKNQEVEIQIFSREGQLIKNLVLDSYHPGKFEMNLGDLSDGLYLIKAITPTVEFKLKKVVLLRH